jgi:hypothetical protein
VQIMVVVAVFCDYLNSDVEKGFVSTVEGNKLRGYKFVHR